MGGHHLAGESFTAVNTKDPSARDRGEAQKHLATFHLLSETLSMVRRLRKNSKTAWLMVRRRGKNPNNPLLMARRLRKNSKTPC